MTSDGCYEMGRWPSDGWSASLLRQALTGPPPDLPPAGAEAVAGAPGVLAVVTELCEADTTGLLEQIEQDAPGARQILTVLLAILDDLLRQTVELQERSVLEQRWGAAQQAACRSAALARALGRRSEQLRALAVLAGSRRRAGDRSGALEGWREVLLATADRPDEHAGQRAVAHGNAANILREEGRLDEALRSVRLALDTEPDPAHRGTIRSNLALVLADAGEVVEAARILRKGVSELEAAGIVGRPLALALDNVAATAAQVGDADAAVELAERARTCFPVDDLRGRAINAQNRAAAHLQVGDLSASAAAVVEAYALTAEVVRGDMAAEHYHQGAARAAQRRLPADHEAQDLRSRAGRAAPTDPARIVLRRRAADSAQAAGDLALALRCQADIASALFDTGRIDEAVGLARQVQRSAARSGLAGVEAMCHATLAALVQNGADTGEDLGVLGSLLRAQLLSQLHAAILAAEASSDPFVAWSEAVDPGPVHNQLGNLFAEHGADGEAREHFRRAIAAARRLGAPHQLVNRLANLRGLLARTDRPAADSAAAELGELVEVAALPDAALAIAHADLGDHHAGMDPARARAHLAEMAAAVERMRERQPPGPARSGVGDQVRDRYRLWADLARAEGDVAAAWSALQGARGRRLVDVLAARAEPESPRDGLPAADEMVGLLTASAPGTALVDLVVDDGGAGAYVLDEHGVHWVHVAGDTRAAAGIERLGQRDREARLLELCTSHPVVTVLIAAVEDALPDGRAVLVVPDRAWENLPLHAVPVDGRPWGDVRGIGLLPAAAVLRFISGPRTPTGRAVVAGDSAGDLPFARTECLEVASALEVEPLVGQACTADGLAAALSGGDFDVVHLAVHGRGDPARGGRASMLLADGTGGTRWAAVDDLVALPWRAELVVLSGCSTGVAGPRHRQDLLGVARAVVEGGATAVLSCLWPVGDEAARVFMSAFYRDLATRQASGRVDLRDAVATARRALRSWQAPGSTGLRRRDGRHVGAADPAGDEAYPAAQDPAVVWAPFVLMGDPIIGC